MEGIARKWRPTLAMIVYAVLIAVLALPVTVVVLFRSFNATDSQFTTVELFAIAVAFAITLVVGFVFTRTITGPINALIRTTEAIRSGGRSAIRPPAQQGTREIAVLSQSFLDLAERLVERSDYVQSFAAHVSHELKSPLTSIKGSAELLRDADMTAAERERFLAHIIADSDRLAALLDRLRALTRAEVPLDGGGATVAAVAASLGRIPVTVSGDADMPTALSLEAAAIVFGHLADNAAQHGATELSISAHRSDDQLVIQVADNGTGIAPGNRDKVFEPFFTTRRESGGTGMGLDIVRAMLQAHGGRIVLAASQSGAAFEVTVPVEVQAK